ncbi:MAG: cation:proton antiporter [Christensenellales bacterium]|jgi:Kef-type K+ transport system membrane component KefB
MNTLLALALAMAVGLALTRVVKLVNLPNVTGFLIAGLLVGPYCLKFVAGDFLESFNLITTVALGFIAFSIGGEFKLSHIRQIGSKAITITMFQALTAVLLVDVALILAGFDVSTSLTLGAIAAATAPAATLMVVRQYKADGPVTRTLLPVVAMDDAVGLMAFSISLAIAKALAVGDAMTVHNMLLEPLVEIVLSLAIGFAIGAALALMMRFFKSRANRLSLMVCAVFLGVALSEMLGLSSLLVCMMIGAGLVNLRSDAEVILEGCDRWTPPLFMLFFVISGAELDLAVIPTVGLLGVIYLFVRSLGKYFGSLVGAKIAKADPNVTKYLGVTLLPQAGVAIGMAQMAMAALPEHGVQIRAVVLCATLVYELVGPVLTKIALVKAGEIQLPEKGKKAAA